MKMLRFSKRLLQLLKDNGIRYCYLRTLADGRKPDVVNIILTPCLKKPDIRRLPKQYDTFFSINCEPQQMASCIDEDTHVYLDMNVRNMKGAL
jgi:hypothetical protein